MKQTTFTFLLLYLLSHSLHAQTDTIYYYNQYGTGVERDSAEWYRKVHFINLTTGESEATDYYKDGAIARSKGPYVKDSKGIYPSGNFINYNKKGVKISEGVYVYNPELDQRGKRIGKWMEYDDKGNKEWEYYYDGTVKKDYNDERVISYWDSTGKQIFTGGNGSCTYKTTARVPNQPEAEVYKSSTYKDGKLTGKHLVTFAATGKTFVDEEFADGVLVKGTSYDSAGREYHYTKSEIDPEFPGGDGELIRFLQKNIRYPQLERDNDIQGKVLLRFMIDTAGKLADITVMRHVSPGLDNESVRVVSRLPDFKPGRYKGQLVKVWYNLPVVYKLQ